MYTSPVASMSRPAPSTVLQAAIVISENRLAKIRPKRFMFLFLQLRGRTLLKDRSPWSLNVLIRTGFPLSGEERETCLHAVSAALAGAFVRHAAQLTGEGGEQ
jgi:hypothetical protein